MYSNQDIRLMVIDDISANLEILEEILSSKGYQVSSFPRGDMALSSVFQNPPDLILLDIMMPHMDGFEVCQRLKDNECTSDIPVIFISALDDTENKVKALLKGGVDYISKPFQEEEVFARIDTHLKLSSAKKKLEEYNLHLEELVQEKVQEISHSQVATLVALSNLAEYRDDTTGSHIERTRDYCLKLAEYLSLYSPYDKIITSSYIQDIYFAAPLHDIGKVGIPDMILLKPSKLSPQEFEIMKTHTVIGAQILEKIQKEYPNNSFINMGLLLTKYHHEKWNGLGYPEGISKEDIPLCARIMAVADVYDALRSRRTYKEGYSHEDAVKVITEENGQSFDPYIVEAFISLEKEFALIFDRWNLQHF